MDQTSPPRSPARALGGRRPAAPRRVTVRGVLRVVALVLIVLVPSAMWGITTASAEASLGPHLARYEVTTDGEVTVDLGPLGTLVVDSPLPARLGAEVVVKEIPREVTAVDRADTLAALGEDLQGYVQFFSGPEATLTGVVRALVLDAARRTAFAMVALAVLAWAVRALLGEARRGQLLESVRRHQGMLAGGTVLAVLVVGTVTASGPRAMDGAGSTTASRVFEGTPLEGARITGRLAGVIDTYGGYLVDAYRSNEDFYDTAVASLDAAWDTRDVTDETLLRLRSASWPGGLDDADPARDDTDEQAGAGDDEADDAGEPADEAPAAQDEAPEPVVALVVSDLHCNVGMARVIRAAAERAGADLVLNAGDTTVNGTAVEEYCITAFAQAVPDGAVMVVADGNHDSAQTAAQERQAGATVLDGEVVEVAGLRILGDSDPNETRIGSGTSPVGEETMGELGRRLSEVACDDPDGVDLLLVHNPNAGTAALESGCVPAQVSGHQHRRTGPLPVGEGIRYVSSSSAGAALGQPTIGPLNGVAELTVLRFDPETGRVLDYRLVQVRPDATVTVGIALSWPRGTVLREPPGAAR